MKRGYAIIALDNPKTASNVGSVMRLSYNYGVAAVVSTGMRYKRNPTDTPAGVRHLPLIDSARDVFDHIPFDCVPVAVDLVPGARSLYDYTHPERAFYIFGAEDSTLGNRIVSRCRDIVYIPTRSCMNLAVSVGVVLYDRAQKRGEKYGD